jgi:hypothetical protein
MKKGVITMGKLGKIIGTVCIGYLAYIVTHGIGYNHGVKDVLKENDIDSFTYKTKHGSEIVYRKPE